MYIIINVTHYINPMYSNCFTILFPILDTEYVRNTYVKPGAGVFMFASLALNILLVTSSNYSINIVF